MRAVAQDVRKPARIYLVGGGSAVLRGWRSSTVDVDIRIIGDSDAVFSALPALKESLQINVELASPADFLPELPGWEERSIFIGREGAIDFFHYDFYSQCLAKLERGHAKDLTDVEAMLRERLVEPRKLRELFDSIEPLLIRYPAVDPATLRRSVEAFAARLQ